MNEPRLKIWRYNDTGRSTLGIIQFDCDFVCYTLELPNKGNQRLISCIPANVYPIRKRSGEESGKYKYDHIHIMDVPDRDHILIHIANYPKDILGCVGVGLTQQEDFVGSSKLAFDELMSRIDVYLQSDNPQIKIDYL